MQVTVNAEIDNMSALCRRMLKYTDQEDFNVMAEYLKQSPKNNVTLHQLISYGIPTEVAIYALLSTGSQGHEAALTFIFEKNEHNG